MSGGWEGLGALRTLYLLRLRGSARRFAASLRRPRRVLVLLVMGGLLALVVWAQSVGGAERGVFSGADAERLMAVLFLVFLVTTVANALSNGVLAFTPAELQFLFPAPVGTRALLLGHVVASLVKSTTAGLLFSVFLRPWDTSYLRSVAGYLVLFLTLILAGLVADLSVLHLGRARRKWLGRAVGLGALGVAALVVGGQALAAGGWDRSMIEPLGWPVRPWVALFTASSGGEAAGSLALCLGVCAALLVRPLTFRGNVRESATHSSERVHQQLRRLSKGNVGQDRAERTRGRVLPMLPRLGGAGVHAWRQLSSLSRRRRSYLMLVVMTVFAGIPGAVSAEGDPEVTAGIVLGILAFAGPLYVQCDFRSDYDCLAYLRSLPSRPAALAAGQVLASVLVIFGFQVVFGGWIFFAVEPARVAFWGLVYATLPLVVALELCVENGAFLLYPYRIDYTRGPPGAVQIARMYALMLGKLVTTILGLLVALAPAALVWSQWRAMLPAALVAWLVLAGEVVLLVWFVGRLFVRVDPSRDLGE